VIPRLGWAPAAVLAVGAALATVGVKAQRALSLRVPLAQAVPKEINGLRSRDVTLSEAEARVAAVTSYLARNYESADSARTLAFSLYVGYYDEQTQGQTIHSPKNCLPGSGWVPSESGIVSMRVPGAAAPIEVNRYDLSLLHELAYPPAFDQG